MEEDYMRCEQCNSDNIDSQYHEGYNAHSYQEVTVYECKSCGNMWND